MSFALVFILMAAYYILKPVRDSFASDWTDVEVSTLWTITFLFSFVVTAVYGFFASRIQLNKLVPSVYGFFAATFILVYVLYGVVEDANLMRKFFYVWVSVFSLFQVSVFWSFMSDLFSKEQSKRLFGFITTGASIGAILGPSIPLLFASSIGNNTLLLIASIILICTIPIILAIQTWGAASLRDESVPAEATEKKVLGGNPLAGFALFFKNPFLLGIGAFIFLYTGIGSFVYFELKNLLADFTNEQRTQIWAGIDFATNSITIITGTLITSRLATKLGLSLTLALIPVLVCLGLLTVALIPLVWIVVGLQVFRRAGNYGITRPAREMLFTVVSRETRFKAKQVIDVVVYRGGDVFWAWSFTLLTSVVGLGVAGVALVGAGIAGVWTWLGLFMGRKFSAAENAVNPQATPKA